MSLFLTPVAFGHTWGSFGTLPSNYVLDVFIIFWKICNLFWNLNWISLGVKTVIKVDLGHIWLNFRCFGFLGVLFLSFLLLLKMLLESASKFIRNQSSDKSLFGAHSVDFVNILFWGHFLKLIFVFLVFKFF